MSLTIARLSTRCSAPRRHEAAARAIVEGVSRGPLRRALAERLGSFAPSAPEVVRVRRLRVRLELAADDLEEGRLSCAWAAGLSRALAQALADPSSDVVVTAQTRAEWIARLVDDAVRGDALVRWEYGPEAKLVAQGTAATALELLRRYPARAHAVLATLASRGRLARALAYFGELDLEALIRLLTEARSSAEAPPTAENLADLAEDLAELQARTPAEMRRRAIAVYIERIRRAATSASSSPRAILHALVALEWLAKWLGVVSPYDWPLDSLPEGPRAFAVAARRAAVAERDTLDGQAGERLAAALDRARPARRAEVRDRLVQSSRAGVLLLAPLLDRLGWPGRLREALGEADPDRALHYLLAGIAWAAVGEGDMPERELDPAIALLAGWLGEPPIAGVARFFADGGPMPRARVECALLAADHDPQGGWQRTLERLGGELVRLFAAGIPGFRKASRAFVAARFLAVPGSIRITDDELALALAPNPFAVALRVGGLDAPSRPLDWLGGRRLRVRFEGAA